MASINYDSIFSMFLGSITDIKIVTMEEEDVNALLIEYLHKALSATYLSHLFSSALADDDAKVFSYTLAYSQKDDEEDFVCNAIAKWMVYEWLHNQVRSVINTAQFFGGSEQKYYSQQAHMSELRALQDDAYQEARRFVMDRGWIRNSYLGGT